MRLHEEFDHAAKGSHIGMGIDMLELAVTAPLRAPGQILQQARNG